MCIQYHEVCERGVLLGNKPKIFSLSPVVPCPWLVLVFRETVTLVKRSVCVGVGGVGWGRRALKRKPNPGADDGSQETVKRSECYYGVQIFGNLEDLKI